MKSFTLFFILWLIFLPKSNAQEYLKEFERVSGTELDLKQYKKDPDAGAVVLFDIGESVFYNRDNSYEIHFTRTTRIKILNKSGLEYSEISIPYYVDGYGKTERIRSIEAYTYNFEDGKLKKTSLNIKNVYEEQVNDNWFRKKFAMPEVKEGSIIEYKYILETPFHFNLPDWNFQRTIPTIYSKYQVSMIPFYDYTFILQGASRFTSSKSFVESGVRRFARIDFQDVTHEFVMKDVPAFKDESFITSREDYIIKLDFQLSTIIYPDGKKKEIITTWPELNTSLLKHNLFGKYLKSSEKFSEKIIENDLELTGKKDIEKLELIVNYVKTEFNWNGISRIYASSKPKELFKNKTGSSAEINLFLIGMLKAAGLDAKPVIMSTRDHGKIKIDYPFEHFFNYTIVCIKINDQLILTDATDDYLPYNRIPPRCINDKGLIVEKNKANWVSLNITINSIITETLILELHDDAYLFCDVKCKSIEYESYVKRTQFKDNPEKIEKWLEKKGFKEIENLETINYRDQDSAYYIKYHAKYQIDQFDNKIVIPPFLGLPISENELKQKTRTYPIDMIYSNTHIFNSSLKIPPTYQIIKIPDDYTYENNLVKITYKSTEIENSILIEGLINFKKSIYSAKDYEKLKIYFNRIIAKFNDNIILTKKT